jgi:Gluconate 2-dehydrogenase subunit 3
VPKLDNLFMSRIEINRREALRLLATGATVPLLSQATWARLRQAREALGSSPAPRTLDRHQYATVKTLAELIIPKTDTPGASDVGAADFIDLLLTEWYDGPGRDRFLSGLSDLDARAQSLFSRKMINCSAAQRTVILRVLGEEMVEEASIEQRITQDNDSGAPEAFYPMLRRMTLTAYYTSEAGATEELHFEIVPGRYDGCADAKVRKEAVQPR